MEVNEWKALPQWVGWKKTRGKNGRFNKVPKDPHTGRNARFNDPSTWATADVAWKARCKQVWQDGKQVPQWDGITFVMTKESGVVGIDLDDCFIEGSGRHVLKPYAKRIVTILDSRTEYSPSGNGLHIFCTGQIQENIHKPGDGFEMYADRHGLTVTGKLLNAPDFGIPELPKTLEERTAEMCALAAPYLKEYDRRRYTAPPLGASAEGITAGKIRELLNYLPTQMDYNDWLHALMAVHSVFPGADGIALINEWCPGFDAEVETKFRSFRRSGPDVVNIGTLFELARRYGARWTTN